MIVLIMVKVKSNRICTRHKCDDCGKNLRSEMSKGEKIFFTVFISIPLLLTFFLTNLAEKNIEKYSCSKKTYYATSYDPGLGDVEYYIFEGINCPEVVGEEYIPQYD